MPTMQQPFIVWLDTLEFHASRTFARLYTGHELSSPGLRSVFAWTSISEKKSKKRECFCQGLKYSEQPTAQHKR